MPAACRRGNDAQADQHQRVGFGFWHCERDFAEKHPLVAAIQRYDEVIAGKRQTAGGDRKRCGAGWVSYAEGVAVDKFCFGQPVDVNLHFCKPRFQYRRSVAARRASDARRSSSPDEAEIPVR